MKKNLLAFIFTLIFLIIGFFMHYFVVSFLSQAYLLFVSPAFWSLAFLLVFIIEAYVAHTQFNLLGRIAYYLFGFHLGLLWISFSVGLFFSVLVMFFDVYLFYFPVVTAIVLYGVGNAWFVRVRKVRIKKGHKLKIAHISDLHLGPVLRQEFLECIIKKVNSLKPDVICITGDIIEDARWFDGLKVFDKFKAPVYAVLGNHDMLRTVNEKLQLLKKTKVKILRNENELCCGVNIIGINETLPLKGRVKNVLTRAYEAENLNILLTHQPITFRLLKGYPVDLELAGHTHGGQIFPFALIIKLFYPAYRGLYHKNGKYIHVSQGTGFWGPPIRFMTNNEISIIEIE